MNPQAAPEQGPDHERCQHDDRRRHLTLQREGRDRGPQGPEHQLAFDADVEHAGPERDGDGKAQ